MTLPSEKNKVFDERFQKERMWGFSFSEKIFDEKFDEITAAKNKFFNSFKPVPSEVSDIKLLEDFKKNFLKEINDLYVNEMPLLKEELKFFLELRSICKKEKNNNLAKDTLFKESFCQPFVNGFSMHAYAFLFCLSQAIKRQNISLIEAQLLIDFFYACYVTAGFHSICEMHAAFLRVKEKLIDLNDILNGIIFLPADFAQFNDLEKEVKKKDYLPSQKLLENKQAAIFSGSSELKTAIENDEKTAGRNLTVIVIGTILGCGLGLSLVLLMPWAVALSLGTMSVYVSSVLAGVVGAGLGAFMAAASVFIYKCLTTQPRINLLSPIRFKEINQACVTYSSTTLRITSSLPVINPSAGSSVSHDLSHAVVTSSLMPANVSSQEESFKSSRLNLNPAVGPYCERLLH